MSASKSVCSRRLIDAPIVRGWKSQNNPWWQSTNCARSAAARSNSSSWADTPVTTTSTSVAPGTWRPLGP